MALDDAATILLLNGRDKWRAAAAEDDRSSPPWRVLERQPGGRLFFLEGHQLLAANFEPRPAGAGVGIQPQLQFITQECARRPGSLTDVIHRLLRHDHFHGESHALAAICASAMENGADISGPLATAHGRRGVHERTRRERPETADGVET